MAKRDDEPDDLLSVIRSKRKNNKESAAVDTQKLPGSQFLEHPMASTLPNSDAAFNRALSAYKPQDAGDISPPAPNTSFPSTADQAIAPNDSTDIARRIMSQAYPHSQAEPSHEGDAAQSSSVKEQSPAASVLSEDLEDIDLRSSSDDPDYEFIEKSGATHSARNAQSDRADKYPDLVSSGSKGKSTGGKGKGSVSGKKSWRRGWFS
jgi:hypothetical protein